MPISSTETPFPKPANDDGSPPQNIVENINSDTSHSTTSTDPHLSGEAKNLNPNLTIPSSSSQHDEEAAQIAHIESSKYIVKQLKELYRNHVVDAEKRYHLHFNFRLPTDGDIRDNEFDAAPMVLLIGQYSTGKVWSIAIFFSSIFLRFID